MSKLGGWWRLWAVGSAIILAAAVTIALFENDYYADGVQSTSCVPGTLDPDVRSEISWVHNPRYFPSDGSMTMGQVVDGATEWEQLLKERGIDQPDEYALPVNKDTPTFGCASWNFLGKILLAAFGLIIALLLSGLAVRWISRGFRN